MKLIAIATLSAATLALAACGHKTETTETTNVTTVDTTNDTATNETAAVVPAGGAQAFVNTAAASDAFEIATSKLALTASSSAPIKKFAQKMIDAHTASTAKLKGITAALTPVITPDPTLNADQEAKLDALKGKTGPDFDAAYKAAQTAGHQATLDALRGYSATGDVPELKTFATTLTPTVAAHLNMAEALKG